MILTSTPPSQVIFDFNKNSGIKNWVVVDDGVMGGLSSSTFKLNTVGNGVFEGNVSLENNGGFSSVRHYIPKVNIKDYTKIVIRLRGDGENYQFRIKANSNDPHSFIAPFSTSGKWQEIEIPLNNMYPSFRGRKLNKPNFSDDYFESITFLIGNKRKEHFKLLIDKIEIK